MSAATPSVPTRPVDPPPGAIASGPVPPPDTLIHRQAAERLAALAIPAGAWGRLGDLAVWWSSCQGQCPPTAPSDVRAVLFAGDHGVAGAGVSAYPSAVTPAMLATVVAGGAGISVLARQHGVRLRVVDIAVAVDVPDLPADVTADKVRHGSGSIDREDACTAGEIDRALAVGARIAEQEIADGAQLLVVGDLGIGNTTPAAVLIGALLGLDAATVTGRGTGLDDAGLTRKQSVVAAALDRASHRNADPRDLLAAVGSADIAAAVGFLVTAARHRVPVLLDGLIALAEAVVAERLAPGTAAWCAAGHRSTEPAQTAALQALGLHPLLDLGMRLGEGTGAVAAVPLVRSAALVLSEMALLADVL